MSRDSRQIAAVVLTVLRLTRGKIGMWGVGAVVLAAVLYAAVLQPLAERSLGVELPSIAGEPTVTQTADDPAPPPAVEPDSPDQRVVLEPLGRDAYRSPAGLRYTRGSQQGHRLKHLMTHAEDDPDRNGPHGVFDADEQDAVVLLVDEAYRLAINGGADSTEHEGQRTVYEVDLGRRIGYVGGSVGARRGHPAAQRVRLVVDDDRLITAFPISP